MNIKVFCHDLRKRYIGDSAPVTFVVITYFDLYTHAPQTRGSMVAVNANNRRIREDHRIQSPIALN